MNVYHFHPETGEFLGPSVAETDPLDPSHILVPAFATLTEPPEEQEGDARVFKDDTWSQVVDHREETWWDDEGRPVVVDFLGDPAEHGLLDTEPEIEPDPPTLADYENAIQGLVDMTATEKMFRDGVTLASYVASTNPQWAAEAQAFVAWRDAVWAYSYAELAKVQAGEREQPSPADFLTELPAIVWPD